MQRGPKVGGAGALGQVAPRALSSFSPGFQFISHGLVSDLHRFNSGATSPPNRRSAQHPSAWQQPSGPALLASLTHPTAGGHPAPSRPPHGPHLLGRSSRTWRGSATLARPLASTSGIATGCAASIPHRREDAGGARGCGREGCQGPRVCTSPLRAGGSGWEVLPQTLGSPFHVWGLLLVLPHV